MQAKRVKLHSHKLCVENTVDITVSVKGTKIRSYLIPAIVVGEASQTFYGFQQDMA